MEQYIKKSALVAEINQRIIDAPINYIGHQRVWAYNDVKDILDTLEVKEIDNVWKNASDFPKAETGRSILLIEDNGHAELLKSPSAERIFYFRPTIIKMWAYVDELLFITTHFGVREVVDLEKEATEFVQTKEFVEGKESPVLLIAKHFFELGLNSQTKDMQEALRMEYEKGRADVINLTLQWLANKWPSYCDNPNIIDAYNEAMKE